MLCDHDGDVATMQWRRRCTEYRRVTWLGQGGTGAGAVVVQGQGLGATMGGRLVCSHLHITRYLHSDGGRRIERVQDAQRPWFRVGSRAAWDCNNTHHQHWSLRAVPRDQTGHRESAVGTTTGTGEWTFGEGGGGQEVRRPPTLQYLGRKSWRVCLGRWRHCCADPLRGC